MSEDKPSTIIPPGAYRLARDVKNPRPDRRKTRDWRASPTWKEGTEFVVREQRREHVGEDILAQLPEDKRARIMATLLYTVIEATDQSHPSLHRIGPGADEQYAALAAALVPTEESLAQFMTRIDLDSGFVQWLVERGAISRRDVEMWWQRYQYGDDVDEVPCPTIDPPENTDDDITLNGK